jgi:hypothetical protein
MLAETVCAYREKKMVIMMAARRILQLRSIKFKKKKE